MKKSLKIMFYTVVVICLVWGILTVVVEKRGPKKSWDFGDRKSIEKVLIVYDPDPFYNFDEQVCHSFAEELAANGMNVKVVSVSSAEELVSTSFNVFVFCANTYNWSPDWALTDYIHEQASLNNKPVIAITLGSGSTRMSQKKLEQLITQQEGRIIDSRSLWLLRPNDEARIKESNVQVALSVVRSWAKSIVHELQKTN